MPFRPITFEDINQGTSKEKRRYYQGKMVVADLGPEHEARLRELRERSKELNRCLQEQFEAKGLPFSTKKDHDKIIRVSAQMRTQFLKTDLADEEKAGKRFTGSSDEADFFLHLNDDNTYDSGRAICGSPYISVILFDHLLGKQAEIGLRAVVNTGDNEKIAEYLADALAKSYGAKKITAILMTKDVDATKTLLAEFPAALFRRQIAWNLTRSLLRNLFAQKTKAAVEQKQNQEQLTAELTLLADTLLSLPGNHLSIDAKHDATLKDALILEMCGAESDSKKPSPILPERRINEIVKDLIKKSVDLFKKKKQNG